MTVVVIGAGQIGRTVAHAISDSRPVVLVDVRPEALADARDHIRRVQAGRVLRGASTVSPAETLARLTFTENLGTVREATMVVENITEDLQAKLRLHEQLGALVGPGTVVGVNTSVIPISTFAGGYADPGCLVGLHFMNPATEIPAVEVVRSPRTSDDTLAAARGQLASWGFTPIVVDRDTPGFVINRILMPVVNDAAALVDAGVADARTVDALFESCLGHPSGPLATADLIGLDTVADSLTALAELTGDDRFRPSPLLARLVRDGCLGRKSGTGFHRYGGSA